MPVRAPLAAVRRLATLPPASGFSAIRELTSPLPPAFTAAPSSPHAGLPPPLPPPLDPTLALLTNCLMKHGKKTEAQNTVHRVLALLHDATHSPPQPLLRRSVLLASPSVKILSMRKSAKTILTPRALNERQRTRQGIAWILKAAEKGRKAGVPRDQRIAREVLAVLEGQSEVFKWLEDVHKVAYLNRSNMNVR